MRVDRTLFLTGTDTGVGKTYVCACLLKHFASKGYSVVGVKPVESGCGGAIKPSEDGAVLAAASGQSSPRAALTRLGAPVAPAVAAEAEDMTLSMSMWIDVISKLSDEHDLVIVEGAGGLLSPLTWNINFRDLIRSCGGPALVVAPDRVGVLNQVLVTLEALGRSTHGVVLSAPAKPDVSTGHNELSLVRLIPELRVATLGRGDQGVSAVASWVGLKR